MKAPFPVPPPEWSSAYSGYHCAAAFAARFDPERLRPAFDASDDDFDRLLADSTVIGSAEGEARWALRQDVRREVLRAIPADRRLGARKANTNTGALPDNDPVQRQLDAYLLGNAPPVQDQSESELAATVRVFEWAEGVFEQLPSRDDLTAALQRARLLAPFRYLTADGFVGRQAELEELRNFVGHREALTPLGAVARRVRETFGLRDREPLVLHGVGGSGKSTLLAQFILEHVQTVPPLRYAYLDLDRAELQANEPLTLLAEVAAQLGLQIPGMGEEGIRLKTQLLGDVHNRTVERNAARSFDTALGEAIDATKKVFGLLGPSAEGERFLLVLDTFEQAQYRNEGVLQLLWFLFRFMTDRYPLVRIVISGRAELPAIDGVEHTSIPLKELEVGDGARLLMKFGVRDEELAAALADKLGGNPLVLRLAAGLVLKDANGEAKAMIDLPTRRYLFLRTDSRVIQGMLYRRFLGHLEGDDPRLVKLAHPGLTLRVITPALVCEVLAGPCGLGEVSEADAQYLVRALASNVWIVTQEEEGVVRHRPDLRSVMLRLLEEDMPERFRRICEAAVAFYAKRKTSADRAEEIYHRILLGEDFASLRAKWEPGVEQYLFSAVEDLRDSRRTVLQLLLGTQVSNENLDELDADTRLRLMERDAARLLDLNRPVNALELLSSHPDPEPRPPNLRLVTLRGRALVAAGDPASAYEFMQRYPVDALANNASGTLEFLLAKSRAFQLSGVTYRIEPNVWAEEFSLVASLHPSDTAGLLQLGVEHLLAVSAIGTKGSRREMMSARRSIEVQLAQIWHRSGEALPGGSVALAWRLVAVLAVNQPAAVAEVAGGVSIAQRLAHYVLETGPDGDPALPCTAVPGMSLFMDPVDRLWSTYPGLMAEAGVVERDGSHIEPLNLAARARALDLLLERLPATDQDTRREIAAAAIQIGELHSAISLRFLLGVRGDKESAEAAVIRLEGLPCVYLVNRLGFSQTLRSGMGRIALARQSSSIGAGDLLLVRGPRPATFAWALVREVSSKKSSLYVDYEQVAPAYDSEGTRAQFAWSDYAASILGSESVAHELSIAEAIGAVRLFSPSPSPKVLLPFYRVLDFPANPPTERKRSLVKRVFSSRRPPKAA